MRNELRLDRGQENCFEGAIAFYLSNPDKPPAGRIKRLFAESKATPKQWLYNALTTVPNKSIINFMIKMTRIKGSALNEVIDLVMIATLQLLCNKVLIDDQGHLDPARAEECKLVFSNIIMTLLSYGANLKRIDGSWSTVLKFTPHKNLMHWAKEEYITAFVQQCRRYLDLTSLYHVNKSTSAAVKSFVGGSFAGSFGSPPRRLPINVTCTMFSFISTRPPKRIPGAVIPASRDGNPKPASRGSQNLGQ